LIQLVTGRQRGEEEEEEERLHAFVCNTT
jgi:hypothetical protein